jgi:hypothetical protein
MFEILSTCKGGGYTYCRTYPANPKANSKGLYPLHRVIAENKIGRLLSTTEDVHHIDGDKMNNSPENLEVLSKSEHAKKHAKRLEDISIVCSNCQSVFKIIPRLLRLRKRRNKAGKVFCSRSCGAAA